MEKNIDILQFLDGTLSHEEEAELLHRLSVSPERRDILRSYIDQRGLFQRDREAINVPYTAEQKLWSRLGELMPIAPVSSVGTAIGTASRGLRWTSIASVGAVCVILGLLSGFYFGRNSATEQTASTVPISRGIVEQPIAELPVTAPTVTNIANSHIVRQRSEAPLMQAAVGQSANTEIAEPFTAEREEITPAIADITAAQARSLQQEYAVLEPRERERSLAGLIEATQERDEEVYTMELSFAESFGKQFPEDAVSRNTQPLITNSAVTGLYQIYRGPVELWAGVSIGSANFARKMLREEQQETGRIKLVDDIAHMQTTWAGPVAQARHRLNEEISLMASAGASYSDLGMLFFGEVAGRYDLTSQVGITLGLRSFHLPYNLTEEQNTLINAKPWLDLARNKYGAEWSHNLEFLTGMYFRF